MLKLIFTEQTWPSVLPEELVRFRRYLKEGDDKKWSAVPLLYWPTVLSLSRAKYWEAFKAGRDTRCLLSFTEGSDTYELTKYIKRDPAGLYALVSVPVNFQEEVARFTHKVLEQMTEVLEESNVQDGKIHAGVISAKARAYTNLKGCVDTLLKMREFETSGGSSFTPLPGPMGVADDRVGMPDMKVGSGDAKYLEHYAPTPDVPLLLASGPAMDREEVSQYRARGAGDDITDKLKKNEKDTLDAEFEVVMKDIRGMK